MEDKKGNLRKKVGMGLEWRARGKMYKAQWLDLSLNNMTHRNQAPHIHETCSSTEL